MKNWKNLGKRGAAMLLSLAVCLSLLPGTALAKEGDNGKNGHVSTHGDAVGCQKCAQDDHWADNNGKAHEVHYCKCCGAQIQKEGGKWVAVASEHTHSYDGGAWVQKGTARHAQVCDVCGEEAAPAVHEFLWETVDQAACHEDGLKKGVCVCGCVIPEIIPATGHTYEDGKCADCGEVDPGHKHVYTNLIEDKAAACTENGVKVYQCTLCEETYTIEYAAAGHSYDQYVATASTPATCTEEGVAAYKCSVCGDMEYQTTPKASHTLETVKEVSATCETTGVKAHKECTVCGEKFLNATSTSPVSVDELVIPIADHVWTWKPSATGVGTHYKVCGVCGSYDGGKRVYEEHVYSDGGDTCDKCGYPK